jgi:hypothetical protein
MIILFPVTLLLANSSSPMSRVSLTRTEEERWHDFADRLTVGMHSFLGKDTREVRQMMSLKQFKINYHIRLYWEMKFMTEGDFHPLQHGGQRALKFGPALKNLLKYGPFCYFHHRACA